jgi:hypothetical protein
LILILLIKKIKRDLILEGSLFCREGFINVLIFKKNNRDTILHCYFVGQLEGQQYSQIWGKSSNPLSTNNTMQNSRFSGGSNSENDI